MTRMKSTTQRIQWSAKSITYSSLQNGHLFHTWTYAGANNFKPGGEVVHINNWKLDALPPTNHQEQDFVIKKCTFTPLPKNPALYCRLYRSHQRSIQTLPQSGTFPYHRSHSELFPALARRFRSASHPKPEAIGESLGSE